MNKVSPQRAIANHCKGCIYDSLAGGTWREQVEACPIVKCELYQHRPLTDKTRQFNREKYLASLTQGERDVILERQARSGQILARFTSTGV